MMNRIKIGRIGICNEHASGKINALRGVADVYEIVGVVDDRTTSAARFAGDNLEPYAGLPWLTEEELFATPGLQVVTVETPNTDLVPTAVRCMERGLAMHMDKPGGEDLDTFDALLTGCARATRHTPPESTRLTWASGMTVTKTSSSKWPDHQRQDREPLYLRARPIGAGSRSRRFRVYEMEGRVTP
jgi:hypothetical protein